MKNYYRVVKLMCLLAIFCLPNLVSAQYCTPAYGNTATDTYISRIQFNTIDKTSNASGTGYQDFTALSTTVSPSSTHTLSVTYYAFSAAGEELWAWFDWNGNGLFTDPGEAFDMGTVIGDNVTATIPITVPATATGQTRFRVIIQEDAGDPSPCPDGNYGEAEDYTVVICDGTPMSYSSSVVTQTQVNPVARGTNNQLIIGVNVVTVGCDNPIIIKSIAFKEGDSDNISTDASSANLYYTRSDNNFAATNLVGNSTAPATTFSIDNIDGSLDNLSEGDNWFWLTYSIPANATLDNYVDAEVENITLSIGGATTVVVPSTPHPTGKRQIANSYCSANHTDEYANDVITNIIFESINQTSGRPASGYTDYSGNKIATVSSGTTQTLSIQGRVTSLNVDEPGASYWLYAYADWNRDGEFNETNEKYFVAEIPGNTNPLANIPFDESISIAIPGDATSGFSRLRIRLFPAYTTQHEACATPVARGEAEDYGLTICGGATVSNSEWFCKGDVVSLTATNYGSSTVSWQASDSASTNWATIASADNVSEVVDSTRFYRALIQESGCPDAYSEIVSISVPEIKEITLNPTSICDGDEATVLVDYRYKSVFVEEAGLTVIPDGNSVTESPGDAVVSVIDLSGAGFKPSQNDFYSIDSVCLNISHSNVEDLRGYLVHQSTGKRVILFDEDDLNGANLTNACFGPMATGTINNLAAPYTGLSLPMGNLNALLGVENNSVWELHLQDMDGGTVGGTGTLDSWSIKLGRGSIAWNPTADITATNSDSSEITVSPASDTKFIATLVDAPCIISDSVEVIVIPQTNPIVSIDSVTPSLNICQGDSITFFGSSNASPAVSPIYAWFVNGVIANSDSASFGVRNLMDGDVVVFQTTISSSCGDFSSTDTAIVKVVAPFTPSVTISSDANPDSLSCEGATIVFSVDTFNPGANPSINWYVNNLLVSNTDTFYTNLGTLNHLDVVRVELSVEESCALQSSASDSLVMNISPSFDPDISIVTTPSGNTFCAGESITFESKITDATPSGELQWYYFNDLTTETNTVWSTDTFGVGTQTLRALYTTNSLCTPTSSVEATFTFEVTNAISPEVTIVVSEDEICEGQEVTFSVDQASGTGNAPTYEWYINGTQVTAVVSDSYITDSLLNADEVYAVLRSDATCAIPSFAQSNSIIITVSDSISGSFDISSSNEPVCFGGSSTFQVNNEVNLGNNPTYVWYINGVQINSADQPSVTIDTLYEGDVITAEITITDVACITNPLTESKFQVSQYPALDPSFSTDSIDVLTYTFTNTSASVTSWLWNFGDETESNETLPTHQYDTAGKYEVCLTVSDINGCAFTSCDTLEVKSTVSVEDLIFVNTLQMYPNPALENFKLHASRPIQSVIISDMIGRQILELKRIGTSTVSVNTTHLSNGIYNVTVESESVNKTLRLTVSH